MSSTSEESIVSCEDVRLDTSLVPHAAPVVLGRPVNPIHHIRGSRSDMKRPLRWVARLKWRHLCVFAKPKNATKGTFEIVLNCLDTKRRKACDMKGFERILNVPKGNS